MTVNGNWNRRHLKTHKAIIESLFITPLIDLHSYYITYILHKELLNC